MRMETAAVRLAAKTSAGGGQVGKKCYAGVTASLRNAAGAGFERGKPLAGVLCQQGRPELLHQRRQPVFSMGGGDNSAGVSYRPRRSPHWSVRRGGLQRWGRNGHSGNKLSVHPCRERFSGNRQAGGGRSRLHSDSGRARVGKNHPFAGSDSADRRKAVRQRGGRAGRAVPGGAGTGKEDGHSHRLSQISGNRYGAQNHGAGLHRRGRDHGGGGRPGASPGGELRRAAAGDCPRYVCGGFAAQVGLPSAGGKWGVPNASDFTAGQVLPGGEAAL